MKENQPKHRQLRKEQRKLARRKASREGYPAILIVCEGRETEPNYIRGFCESRRINLANVTLCAGSYETDAVSLVGIAQRRFSADPDYDGAYVTCDDDGGDLEEARALASKPMKHRDGRRVTVNLICSEIARVRFGCVDRPALAHTPIRRACQVRHALALPLACGFERGCAHKALRVPARCIDEIVREWRGIAADTAVRLARYFGGDAHSWLNLQATYELRVAEGGMLASSRTK